LIYYAAKPFMNGAFLVAKYDVISSAMEVPINVMPI
jgi:hypothetical protein